MRDLPTGTVTFLFSDIEGSTRLLDELGADRYAEALAEHRRLLREAFAGHGGVEVDTQGDAFFVAFPDAGGALAAAGEAQEALAAGAVQVRMGLHTGDPLLTEEGYVGIDVHRGARVMGAGHGGQVLVSEATYALLDGRSGLTDLGQHRLKDLTEPQRLWQLGDSAFPPLKTLYQTNLPVQPTALVGREAELTEVLGLLAASRLVTLTGPGGSGKTRLALQAAAELVDDYEDGVWWVSLGALRDPKLVEPTIAQSVGAKDGLADHLRSKQMLLLLDNFEHLLDAAPRIAVLLGEAPDVRVLATSRERLGLSGEQEYDVPTMAPHESIALFTVRARQLQPKFEPGDVVAEICVRLDGLPLAIELAAARIKVLKPVQILERLGRSLDLLTAGARDAAERHQTLRTTIEWSHDLLSAEEQRLFARLSVFSGSFGPDAAEEVCGADVDTLAALVDKSLIRQTREGRLFMLETIHEFSAEQLAEAGSAERMRRRHAGFFRGLAEEGGPAFLAGVSGGRLGRLQPEQANLRAALDWLFERGELDDACRMCASLWPLWYQLGFLDEARRFVNRALSESAGVDGVVQAGLLACAGLLAREAGDLERAKAAQEQQVELGMELGEEEIRLAGLELLGITHTYLNDFHAAAGILEECVAGFRRSDDRSRLGWALNDLGLARMELGDVDKAWEAFEEGIELLRARDDRPGLSFILHSAGSLAARERDLARAESLLREGLSLFLELGDRQGVADTIETLGTVAAAEGAPERAAVLWGAGEQLRRSIGAAMQVSEREMHDQAVSAVTAALGDEAFEAAVDRGAAKSTEDAVAYALSREGGG